MRRSLLTLTTIRLGIIKPLKSFRLIAESGSIVFHLKSWERLCCMERDAMEKDRVKGKLRSKRNPRREDSRESAENGDLDSTEKLKKFLMTVRDRISDGSSPPIYSLSSLNYVLRLPNVYQIM